MNDMEELKSLAEYIRACIFQGQSYDEIGVDIAVRYIKLVERVEGKSEKEFGKEIITKYPYLMPLSEVRNRALFKGELF